MYWRAPFVSRRRFCSRVGETSCRSRPVRSPCSPTPPSAIPRTPSGPLPVRVECIPSVSRGCLSGRRALAFTPHDHKSVTALVRPVKVSVCFDRPENRCSSSSSSLALHTTRSGCRGFSLSSSGRGSIGAKMTVVTFRCLSRAYWLSFGPRSRTIIALPSSAPEDSIRTRERSGFAMASSGPSRISPAPCAGAYPIGTITPFCLPVEPDCR